MRTKRNAAGSVGFVVVAAACAAAMLLAPGIAEAAGLARANSVLTSLTSDARLLIPAIGTLAVLVLGVLWGCRVVRLTQVVQLGGGIVLAGCAAEVVSMLFA